MIFEQDGLDLTDVSLLTDELGETWLNFADSITDHNTYTFDTSFNLIKLSEPSTVLGTTILEILIDESTETSDKAQLIRDLLSTNIITYLQNFGIVIDRDNVLPTHLPLLNQLLDLIYTLEGFEDILDLAVVLGSTDIDPVDRYIRVFQIINDIDDISDLEHLIISVSEFTLSALHKALVHDDGSIEVPEYVTLRVRNNRDFLKGTYAWEHVINGGNVGGGFPILVKSFEQPLQALLDDHNNERYIKEVIALSLVSEIRNEMILEEISKAITTVIDNPTDLFKADGMINRLQLGNSV